jgi:hypothetical protein
MKDYYTIVPLYSDETQSGSGLECVNIEHIFSIMFQLELTNYKFALKEKRKIFKL